MVKCYLLDGEFSEQNQDNFADISQVVNTNRRALHALPLPVIIEILSALGKKIIQNPHLTKIQGITYLSLWLRKRNLEQICRINYGNLSYPDSFVDVENRFKMTAQPRGVVALWVAANIPTLAIISIVQTILSKNGSIVKVPEENKDILLQFLQELASVEVTYDNSHYSGLDIVKAISVVSFEGRNHTISSDFSLNADCRLVYGGSKAIQSILALPQKDHCETIVYGPKYSFGVFDREFIESDLFEKSLDKMAKDIAYFNQMACSSPQVLFFEKSSFQLQTIGEQLARCFENLPGDLRIQPTDAGILANIINIRAKYLLSDDKSVIASDDLSWTILIDNDFRLEDPVHGKCIFLKEVESLDTVPELITRKIQALSVSIFNPQKRESFAREATYLGVDRIVIPGTIHDYDLPWDGILPLSRLVRWVILKYQ
ncbi:acyl-CoA reductase [Methanogenium marinum]|uniref:Acyl-CoA reductase n=1 Tax=Methanogenium marinum TaxID=348610 RepID=A0A9Q4PWG3_9EURY|nr:acyl-CoA reductase [Methanogenium marinum]MDE4907331.1 acyl-CoA reductase [Methanogenium marinum]